MGRLGELNEAVAAAKRPRAKSAAPEAAVHTPVPVSIDMAPVAAALESLKGAFESSEKGGVVADDIRQGVQALLKGLAPLLKPAELEVEAIVKAIEAIPQPQFEMVVPGGEAVPYTFDIEYRGDGRIQRVVATPGSTAPQESLKQFDYS